MRWLFLLLLAANILFFSWNWLGGDMESDAQRLVDAEAVSQGERRLVLLSELATPPEPRREAASVEQPQVGRSGAEPEVERKGSRSGGETASPLIQPKPENRSVAVQEESCYVLGPFGSASQVQRVLARVETTPAVVERRWSSPRQKPGYWVHIPPAASSSEARAVLRQLSSLEGGADIQLITSGEMRYAISLGIFSTLENARKRVEEVQRIGFDVAINEVQIRKREYWLALRGSMGRSLPRKTIDSLLRGQEGVKVERRSCSRLYR